MSQEAIKLEGAEPTTPPSTLAARNFLAEHGFTLFADQESAELALSMLWLQGERAGIERAGEMFTELLGRVEVAGAKEASHAE